MYIEYKASKDENGILLVRFTKFPSFLRGKSSTEKTIGRKRYRLISSGYPEFKLGTLTFFLPGRGKGKDQTAVYITSSEWKIFEEMIKELNEELERTTIEL